MPRSRTTGPFTRPLVSAALVAFLLAATVAPAGAVAVAQTADPGDPAPAVADVLATFGVGPDLAAELVAGALVTDGVGDTFRYAVPGSVPATLSDPYVDIVTYGGVGVSSPGDPASTIPCGDRDAAGLWVCAGTPDLSADHWVLWMQLAGPVPDDDGGLYWSYAFPLDDPAAEDPPWVAVDPFAWDTFQGTNRWPQLTRSPGTPWRLAVTDTSFTELTSGAFALIAGDTVVLAIPAAETGVAVEVVPGGATGSARGAATRVGVIHELGLRAPAEGDVLAQLLILELFFGAASHVHEGDFGAQPTSTSGVDAAPDTNRPTPRGPGDLASAGTGVVAGPPTDAGEAATPSSTPPTSSAAPASSSPPASTPPTSSPPADGADDGTGPLVWVPPLVLVLLVLGGLLLWWRRRGETPASAPDERDGGADFGVYVETPAGRTPVRTPRRGARHLGDYIIRVETRLAEGTGRTPPTAVETDTQSQRVYLYGWRQGGYDPARDATADTWTDMWTRHHTRADAAIAGAGIDARLVADVSDRQTDKGTQQKNPFVVNGKRLPVRKKSKTTTTATASLVEVTTLAIAFQANGRPPEDHDYAVEAQSSLHTVFRGDCFMHQAGETGHLGTIQVFNKVAGATLAANCATVPTAEVVGETGVEASGGLDYTVEQARPLAVSKGTGGSIVEFGGPEVELALGPAKLGKAAIALKPGVGHLLDTNMWLEERKGPHHHRGDTHFDATITTDLAATATLVTDHEYEIINRIDNGLQVRADAHHELVVRATGRVDGTPIGVTVSLGTADRQRPSSTLSRLAARLAPHDPPAGAHGYVEPLGSSARGLRHPGFATKTGSGATGSAAGEVGSAKLWPLV